MTATTVPPGAYTDAPELHPNLIVGSLQLLFWLFVHPAAWRSHIARIDPDLPPDFCLADLSRAQWRNRDLHRLLVMSHLVLPLLSGLVASLVLWLLGGEAADIAVGIALGLAGGIVGGLVAAATVAVAVGAVGMVVTVTAALLQAAIEDMPGSEVLGAIFGLLGSTPGQMDIDGTLVGIALAAAIGVIVGIGGGIAGTVQATASDTIRSLVRQIGGAVIGILLGIIVFGLAVGVAIWLSGAVPFGAALGVAFGAAIGWRTRDWRRSVVGGLVGIILGVIFFGFVPDLGRYGLADGLLLGLASGMAKGLLLGVWISAFFALPYVLAVRLGGPWAGALAGAVTSAGVFAALWFLVDRQSIVPVLLACLLCLLLGLTLFLWRPVLFYPLVAAWNLVLFRADEQRTPDRPGLLPSHSAFWDEHQRLRLFGLDEHLVLTAERNLDEAQAAFEYLSTSHQRWAAQAAQIELDARRLERCADVAAISQAHHSFAAGELEGPASALLRSLGRISQDVEAALQQESAYNQRLALTTVEDRLDALLRELTRSSDPYAVRFRPITTHWRKVVANHAQHLAAESEMRQEIDSPYVIGLPLTEQQEIFVGRTDTSARIEQLLLDRRRPPLLLYGQRRTGKTSLLHNLGRLLPSTIVPLFVDLQGPATKTNDLAGFFYNLARGMIDSADRHRNLRLPPLSREVLSSDPFTSFDEWLDQVQAALDANTALLLLDEFEALDSAITRGLFDEEAILGTLRHLIQHRARFKVLLSGTHTLDEVQHWASYLINVQVVHIGYLKEDEARRLIERPVKDFALRYQPDASERVLALTRGHPFLVQLLCAEIVALKNEQEPATRRLACLADVNEAVPHALESGRFFFQDIEHNQVDATGLALLRTLAAHGEGAVIDRGTLAQQCPHDLDRALALLTRRELIESTGGSYRFEVELIRRWFAPQDRQTAHL